MLSLTSIFIVPDVKCIAVLFLFILKYSKGLHPMKMKACTVKTGIAQTMKKHPRLVIGSELVNRVCR